MLIATGAVPFVKFKPAVVEVIFTFGLVVVPLPIVNVLLTCALLNTTFSVVENVKFWLSCSIAMFLPAIYVTFPPAFTLAVFVVCVANLSSALVDTLNDASLIAFATVDALTKLVPASPVGTEIVPLLFT